MSRRVLTLVMVAALVTLSGVATVAQETPDPGDEAPRIDVDVGDYTFSIDGESALSACVTETRVTFEGSYASLLVFVRHESGTIAPLGNFDTRMTPDIANAFVGSCVTLGGDGK